MRQATIHHMDEEFENTDLDLKQYAQSVTYSDDANMKQVFFGIIGLIFLGVTVITMLLFLFR